MDDGDGRRREREGETMATTKRMTAATGYHECSTCRERIAVGSYYVRSGSRFTHADPCSAPVVAAPVQTPVAAASAAAVASRPAPYVRRFGALALDGESFRAWEREYDEEGC
jgi:hypothetical protein